MGMLKSLWAYRGFIFGSVKREFQLKYLNSLLGAAWTVLNPLAMIVVYTIIFSEVMRAKLPGIDTAYAYSIYLCSGILTWGLFAEIVGRCQMMFIESANLLKKISFPRLCLPIIAVLSALVNFAIIFGIFTLFLIVSGTFPGVAFIALVPLLIIQIIFSVGLGVTIGILNVFFRDVGQFMGVALQFWFWLTPIVYSMNALPDFLRPYLLLNPMVPLITSYQGILVSGIWPEWDSLWLVGLCSIGLCFLGVRLFRRHAGDMVDEL